MRSGHKGMEWTHLEDWSQQAAVEGFSILERHGQGGALEELILQPTGSSGGLQSVVMSFVLLRWH